MCDPSPCGGEIQHGDVGFIRDGAFQRVFNIVVDKEYPWNPLGVPDYFKPIEFGVSVMVQVRREDACRVLSSRGITIARDQQYVTASFSCDSGCLFVM